MISINIPTLNRASYILASKQTINKDPARTFQEGETSFVRNLFGGKQKILLKLLPTND